MTNKNSRVEKRYSFPINNNAEYRAKAIQEDSKNRLIKGYGAVFDQKSKIITEYIPEKNEVRTFYEIIDSGAFDDILANIGNYDIILNINHQFDELLARTYSGTLQISKDDKGLIYETNLPDTERGNDVYIMVGRNDYYESSFQFIVAQGGDKWELDNATGIYTRTILKVETLIDMCIATYRGAYSNTTIEVNCDNDKSGRIMEYSEEDIAVAKRKLNDLYKNLPVETTDVSNSTDDNYLIELEFDNDKIKMLE